MYNGIGLSSVRGAGTSGYVTRNLATVRRPRRGGASAGASQAARARLVAAGAPAVRAHEKRRRIEVAVAEREDELVSQGMDRAAAMEAAAKLREELMKEDAAATEAGSGEKRSGEQEGENDIPAAPPEPAVPSMAVPEVNLVKEDLIHKMRDALGIRADYKEGASFQRMTREKEKRDEEEEKAGSLAVGKPKVAANGDAAVDTLKEYASSSSSSLSPSSSSSSLSSSSLSSSSLSPSSSSSLLSPSSRSGSRSPYRYDPGPASRSRSRSALRGRGPSISISPPGLQARSPLHRRAGSPSLRDEPLLHPRGRPRSRFAERRHRSPLDSRSISPPRSLSRSLSRSQSPSSSRSISRSLSRSPTRSWSRSWSRSRSPVPRRTSGREPISSRRLRRRSLSPPFSPGARPSSHGLRSPMLSPPRSRAPEFPPELRSRAYSPGSMAHGRQLNDPARRGRQRERSWSPGDSRARYGLEREDSLKPFKGRPGFSYPHPADHVPARQERRRLYSYRRGRSNNSPPQPQGGEILFRAPVRGDERSPPRHRDQRSPSPPRSHHRRSPAPLRSRDRPFISPDRYRDRWSPSPPMRRYGSPEVKLRPTSRRYLSPSMSPGDLSRYTERPRMGVRMPSPVLRSPSRSRSPAEPSRWRHRSPRRLRESPAGYGDEDHVRVGLGARGRYSVSPRPRDEALAVHQRPLPNGTGRARSRSASIWLSPTGAERGGRDVSRSPARKRARSPAHPRSSLSPPPVRSPLPVRCSRSPPPVHASPSSLAVRRSRSPPPRRRRMASPGDERLAIRARPASVSPARSPSVSASVSGSSGERAARSSAELAP